MTALYGSISRFSKKSIAFDSCQVCTGAPKRSFRFGRPVFFVLQLRPDEFSMFGVILSYCQLKGVKKTVPQTVQRHLENDVWKATFPF